MRKRIFSLALLMMLCAGIAIAQSQPQQRTVSFLVPQMHCGNCYAKVKKQLDATEGVLEVIGDIEGKVVAVSYDANQVSPDLLKESLLEIDYTVSRYWPNQIVHYVFYQAEAFPADNTATIKKQLLEEKGVMDVTINPSNHTVSVSYNSQLLNEEQLEKILADVCK